MPTKTIALHLRYANAAINTTNYEGLKLVLCFIPTQWIIYCISILIRFFWLTCDMHARSVRYNSDPCVP